LTLAQQMTQEGTGQQRRLVLASASPRRSQLLREAGYEFAVFPANIDEDSHLNLMPIELARHLSFEKAKAVAARFPHDVVLAADTVVAFGDRPLGKPEDAEDAKKMLTLLSGTTHSVITGVTVVCRRSRFERRVRVTSGVQMRSLSPAEIEAYVASGQWEGKAGGYGIQDQDPFVIKMSGSHTNIVGLPMELVAKMLAEMNIVPARG